MLNFTLTDLRYLLALAEEKHFARAAQKCFVSQPTLSIAIKKLEENLGVNIFERENHQILITPAGLALIEQAKRILTEANSLTDLAASFHDPLAQPLRMGAILTIGPYVFPQLIQQIMNDLPQLKLVVEESYTHVLTDKLLGGELDIILLATEVQHSELVQEVICRDEMKVICAGTNTLAKLKKVDPQALNEQTFFLLGSGHCFRDQVLKVCPQQDSNTNQFASLIITSSLETIKYMVAMNLGVSVLPELAATNLPPKIVIKDFKSQPPYRELSIVYRKNFPRLELVQQIKQVLISLFAC